MFNVYFLFYLFFKSNLYSQLIQPLQSSLCCCKEWLSELLYVSSVWPLTSDLSYQQGVSVLTHNNPWMVSLSFPKFGV